MSCHTRRFPANDTAALIARWPAAGTPKNKPILILAHMDVVEAQPSDWTTDPFKLVEKDGYFYGRGAGDDKGGLVAVDRRADEAQGRQASSRTATSSSCSPATRRRRARAPNWARPNGASGPRPSSRSMPTPAAAHSPATASRSASGCRRPRRPSRAIPSRVRNPGGHSSRPRPDNAIYELADALKKLQAHRFTPMLNETTPRLFHRARQAGRRQRARPGDARLACQSERRRGRRRDRGQPARGGADPHPLRRDHA